MLAKVLCFLAFVTIAVCNHVYEPAYSSQAISRYDGPAIGHGYASRYGYGYGPRYGLGYGPGYGYGHGLGYGHGYGYGHGLGYGHGYGHGYGLGYGLGHGYGLGYGLGHGYGYGHGYGHGHGHGHGYVDYYAYPRYNFGYKVVDHHTGDIKEQQEHRHGDVVKGYYALHQPDGAQRIVRYYADDHVGFQADVKYGIHHLYPRYHS